MLKPVVVGVLDVGLAVLLAESTGVPASVQPRLRTDNSNKVIGIRRRNMASLLVLKSVFANSNKKRRIRAPALAAQFS